MTLPVPSAISQAANRHAAAWAAENHSIGDYFIGINQDYFTPAALEVLERVVMEAAAAGFAAALVEMHELSRAKSWEDVEANHVQHFMADLGKGAR